MMHRWMKISLILLVGYMPVVTTAAADKPDLGSEDNRINYSVGFQIGNDFKRQGVPLAEDALVQGIRDALSGTESQLTQEEMNKTLVELKRKILAEQKKSERQTRQKHRQSDQAFLEDNAKKQGIVVLPSGLQYRIIKEGNGRQPTIKDAVTVHYRGTLVDGSEISSTYRKGEPQTFDLEKVIPGMQEALLKMKEGAHWKVFIPYDLAFGEQGLYADRTVIYDIELLSVKPGK